MTQHHTSTGFGVQGLGSGALSSWTLGVLPETWMQQNGLSVELSADFQ